MAVRQDVLTPSISTAAPSHWDSHWNGNLIASSTTAPSLINRTHGALFLIESGGASPEPCAGRSLPRRVANERGLWVDLSHSSTFNRHDVNLLRRDPRAVGGTSTPAALASRSAATQRRHFPQPGIPRRLQVHAIQLHRPRIPSRASASSRKCGTALHYHCIGKAPLSCFKAQGDALTSTNAAPRGNPRQRSRCGFSQHKGTSRFNAG